MNYLERATMLVNETEESNRYKTLTLEQVRKWPTWQDAGTKMGERWDNGERVYAFEDGTVSFKESGASLQKPFKDANTLALWIKFLEDFDVEWH